MKNNSIAIVCSLIITIVLSVPANCFALEEDETNIVNLSRMFIAPTGYMIPSGVLNVAFGGSFASQGGREYLGLMSIGLGGVAEFEISTSHIITNIFSFTEPIGTTALKFILYNQKSDFPVPTIVLMLRSNAWSTVSGDRGDFAGPALPDGGGTLMNVDFEVHQTSLYLSASKLLNPTSTLHGGLVWHEMRTRDISYYGDPSLQPPGDMNKGIVGIFIGMEREMNDLTHSILEIGSKPKIEFDQLLQGVTAKNLYYMIAGVRYFLTPMASIDAGIRYRSDYSGLSDTEIRTGLNLGIDIRKGIKEKLKRKSKRK